VTVVNRMVDARPCNVFVVLRRVRNSRTIIIIIIKYLKDCTCTGSFGDILADRQTERQTEYRQKFALIAVLRNDKAVTDCRLRPQCYHLQSYFKYTSFSCRFIRRDIMCKHVAMNIQHAHCGLVGQDHGARKVNPLVRWSATGIPTRRL